MLILRLPATGTLFNQHNSSCICFIRLSVFQSINKACGKSLATATGSGLGLTWQFCFPRGCVEIYSITKFSIEFCLYAKLCKNSNFPKFIQPDYDLATIILLIWLDLNIRESQNEKG